jgi:hypothetical protein
LDGIAKEPFMEEDNGDRPYVIVFIEVGKLQSSDRVLYFSG